MYVVHTEDNGILLFLISNKFAIYNNDENFPDGYLILKRLEKRFILIC